MPDPGVGRATAAAGARRRRRCARVTAPIGALGLAALLVGCAQPPVAPADRVERFADAFVQLLPVGRVMDAAAARDARWPLGAKAALVSDRQLGCMRAALSSAAVTPRQRQAARDYARSHADTLDDELQILEAGAAALFGDAMLAAAERRPGGSLAGASPVQAQALVALMTEPRYAALRHASGLDGLLDGGAERARQRGRELGQTLLVRHMTDAFLTCHIPVKLLY